MAFLNECEILVKHHSILLPSTMDWAFRKGFLSQAFSYIQQRRIIFRRMRRSGSSDDRFSSAFGKSCFPVRGKTLFVPASAG